jgi:hypothetical protein
MTLLRDMISYFASLHTDVLLTLMVQFQPS